MKENMGDEELGKPKSHCVGSPTILFFCIDIENLDMKRDFLPVRLVKTYCKKNYFLLQ